MACLNTRLHVGPLLSIVSTVSDVPERWTQASVYPDMWADPDKDPRNRDGASPDGELATLQDFLTDYRLTLRMKCEGLDPEQLARRSVPPSTMSLLGLVRHLAEVERDWRSWILPGDPEPKLYGPDDGDFNGAVAEQVRKGEAARRGIRDLQFYRDDYFAAPELAAPRRFFATSGLSVSRSRTRSWVWCISTIFCSSASTGTRSTNSPSVWSSLAAMLS